MTVLQDLGYFGVHQSDMQDVIFEQKCFFFIFESNFCEWLNTYKFFIWFFIFIFDFSYCVSVLAISGAFSKSFRNQLPFTPKISNFSSRLTIEKWYCNLIFHPCTFENNVDFCRCCSLLSSLSERKSGFKVFHGK